MAGIADTIITGGTVVPVAGPRAEAVAIAAGRVAAVGSRDDVLALRGPRTEIADLRGATLLPGLIEPHTHPDLSAQMYAWVDVSGFAHATVAEVERQLRAAIAAARPGEWVFAFGLDPMLTPDLGRWDRHRLDGLAPENPVVVMLQSMHTVFVNSAALRAAGIDDDTPDPPGGGRFVRDAAGRLTGVAVEQPAIGRFMRFVDQSVAAWRKRLADQYDRYRAAGITAIGAAGLFVPDALWPSFEEVTRAQPVRVTAYLHGALPRGARRPGDGDDQLRLRGVKLWYDGSPYSGTMLLDEPYVDSPLCRDTLGIAPRSCGHANFDPDEMFEVLQSLHRDGWQVMTHVQGDRAVREVLDLYQRVLAASPARDHRWRLDHCALISAPDLARAAALGVAVSFHVNHVRYYGPELRDAIIGPERAGHLMPVATALRAGHRPTLHADSPMYPAGPIGLMRTAVTRQTRTGQLIAPAEAITAEQALRAVTIDAAWQLFADHVTGSIEPGKYADFTVLDRNPLDAPPADWDAIEILGTWRAGRATARAASP
ncbi:MAG: amidohydrolase [Dehalococcoidia bacterium]|nr:MAG: amidohydrolase [Dehalococcoidia bacterium]